jgi:hypothetical protein
LESNVCCRELISEAPVVTLDVGCGKHKRGDIGIDYSRDSEADIIADACYLPFKDEVFERL